MNVCIFTVVKDEQEYLNDFLAYHTALGIDVFVFEDVFSESHISITDNYTNVYLHSVKELYNEEEIPQLIKDRKNKVPPQTDYINRGLRYIHSLDKYDWCWLIDCDEYITSSEPFRDVLRRYNDRDAVLVYWKNFGCSGRLYKPHYDRPIWEIYTEPCGYEKYSDLKYFKITKFCVNMRRWKPTQKWFIHCAQVNYIKADGTYKRTEIVYEPLYLRHYITRSAEEYAWKVWVRSCMHQGHRQWKSLREMDGEIYEKLKADKNFFPYFKEKYGVELPPLD